VFFWIKKVYLHKSSIQLLENWSRFFIYTLVNEQYVLWVLISNSHEDNSVGFYAWKCQICEEWN